MKQLTIVYQIENQEHQAALLCAPNILRVSHNDSILELTKAAGLSLAQQEEIEVLNCDKAILYNRLLQSEKSRNAAQIENEQPKQRIAHGDGKMRERISRQAGKIMELQDVLESVGAGGVESLRKGVGKESLTTEGRTLEHDEDWLEQMYWEFDEIRQKSGDERLRFKGFMRAYGTKCAHGAANLAQMDPCEDDEDESPRQIAAPQPPANGLESLPAMAREIFCSYPTKTQKEIDDVIEWFASSIRVQMSDAKPAAEQKPVAWRTRDFKKKFLRAYHYTDIGLQAEAWEHQGLKVDALYEATAHSTTNES